MSKKKKAMPVFSVMKSESEEKLLDTITHIHTHRNSFVPSLILSVSKPDTIFNINFFIFLGHKCQMFKNEALHFYE